MQTKPQGDRLSKLSKHLKPKDFVFELGRLATPDSALKLNRL